MNKYFKLIILWLFILTSVNTQAQISDTQVSALVEALRLASPHGNLHSDWQVKARNIRSWSKRCLGKTISPQEFADNVELARTILECKMGKIFRKQAKKRNINSAILRTASWWMTGSPGKYASNSRVENFTQNVLGFYQQQLHAQPMSPGNSSRTTGIAATPVIQPTYGIGVSEKNIADFVEALRLAAPKSGRLLSEWQVKKSNIARWSKPCFKRVVSTREFVNDPAIARLVLECKMGKVLRKEYDISGKNISVAVRRAAAWWMTGKSDNYDGSAKDYTLKILDFYLQLGI